MHGAMAQGFGHIILPLCNRRDMRTQVRWGIADFECRYGRTPEGMWLPEAAVNDRVLAVLAEEGIRFTLLAPGQAGWIRPLDDPNEAWAAGARTAGARRAASRDGTSGGGHRCATPSTGCAITPLKCSSASARRCSPPIRGKSAISTCAY